MAETMRGRFVWHELMTPDPKAAASFYGKVVGWAPQAYDKNPNYTMLTYGGAPMGGVLKHDAPRQWLPYIATPNVDVTAREAVQLGGNVVKPAADIPDIGCFAIISDPQGALFVAFTPRPMGTSGPSDKPGLGDFHWHELLTSDWRSAWNFYEKLFGWHKTDAMEMGPGQTYQMFAPAGRQSVGGMFNASPQNPQPPQWLSYAIVKDAKAAATVIEAAGGKVINGPMEVPGGDWITAGVDPQGVTFAVHSRKSTTPVSAATGTKASTAKKRTAKPTSKTAKGSVPRTKTATKKKSTKTRRTKATSVKKTKRAIKKVIRKRR